MNSQNSFQRPNRKVGAYRSSIDGWSALESFFYTLKPGMYLLFAAWVLRSEYATSLPIKYATFCVALFGVYIIISRLMYRRSS